MHPFMAVLNSRDVQTALSPSGHPGGKAKQTGRLGAAAVIVPVRPVIVLPQLIVGVLWPG